MTRRKVPAFPIQKRKYSIHEKLKELVKKKLVTEGYKVYDLKIGLQTHKIIEECFGKEIEEKYFGGHEEAKYPDLIAKKEGEVVIIEIKSRNELGRLKKQIENYQKLAKTVLVFDANTSNLELWGLQDLKIDKTIPQQ